MMHARPCSASPLLHQGAMATGGRLTALLRLSQAHMSSPAILDAFLPSASKCNRGASTVAAAQRSHWAPAPAPQQDGAAEGSDGRWNAAPAWRRSYGDRQEQREPSGRTSGPDSGGRSGGRGSRGGDRPGWAGRGGGRQAARGGGSHGGRSVALREQMQLRQQPRREQPAAARRTELRPVPLPTAADTAALRSPAAAAAQAPASLDTVRFEPAHHSQLESSPAVAHIWLAS